MHEADRKLLCIPLSPNMHNCSPSKMVEDAELRKADRVIQHLSAIYKSYNRIKAKKGRYLLLDSTLEGGSRRSKPSAVTQKCFQHSNRMPLHSSRANSQGAGTTPVWGYWRQG